MNTFISESTDGCSSLDLEVIHLSEHNIVKINVGGIFSVDTNDQLIEAALAAAQRYNTHLFILDMRKMYLEMNHVEVYDLPEHNKQLGVPDYYRVAILYSSTSEYSKRLKFFEDRAVVQDLERQIFIDENSAIDWLLQ